MRLTAPPERKAVRIWYFHTSFLQAPQPTCDVKMTSKSRFDYSGEKSMVRGNKKTDREAGLLPLFFDVLAK